VVEEPGLPPRIERALVTGASAGIGEQFARQLPQRGVALTLVARRAERLEELAAELDVDVEVLPADLTEDDGRARVEQRLRRDDAPVDLLVNNAGFGTYGSFTDLDLERQSQMVDLNATTLLRLSHVALAAQLARGVGGLINVGSTAGFQPDPHAATYGATKAFVRSFTEALAEEVRGTPVRVMLLAPGFTTTEFQDVAGIEAGVLPGPAQMSAGPVVAAALRDFARGRTVCVPGAANTMMRLGADVAPSSLSRRVSGVVHRRFVESS
jgi:uncharacterized protein